MSQRKNIGYIFGFWYEVFENPVCILYLQSISIQMLSFYQKYLDS